jgi:hypothetical protein
MREFKDSVTGHESEEPKQTPPQQIAPVQSVETTATPPVPVESAAAASSSEHERETV